jgi:hypothetical protein
MINGLKLIGLTIETAIAIQAWARQNNLLETISLDRDGVITIKNASKKGDNGVYEVATSNGSEYGIAFTAGIHLDFLKFFSAGTFQTYTNQKAVYFYEPQTTLEENYRVLNCGAPELSHPSSSSKPETFSSALIQDKSNFILPDLTKVPNQTINVKLPGFDSAPYAVDKNDDIVMVVPVAAGYKMSTDNTCQTTIALRMYLNKAGANLEQRSQKKRLEKNFKDLQRAIAFLETLNLQDAKTKAQKRLQGVQFYIAALAVLETHIHVHNLYEFPKIMQDIVDGQTNLFAMHLSPSEPDPYIKTKKPIFSLNRHSAGHHGMHMAEGFSKALHENLAQYSPVKVSLKTVILAEVVKKFPGASFIKEGDKFDAKFKELTDFIGSLEIMKGVIVAFPQVFNPDTNQNMTNYEYCEMSGFSFKEPVKDYAEGLIDAILLANPNLTQKEASLATASPFFTVQTADLEKAREELSIMTQFFCGLTNILCFAKGYTSTNWGTALDGNLKNDATRVVLDALNNQGNVEEALMQFFRSRRSTLGLSSNALTPAEQREIIEEFKTQFTILRASNGLGAVHFDDFMELIFDKKGDFVHFQDQIGMSLAKLILEDPQYRNLCANTEEKRKFLKKQQDAFYALPTRDLSQGQEGNIFTIDINFIVNALKIIKSTNGDTKKQHIEKLATILLLDTDKEGKKVFDILPDSVLAYVKYHSDAEHIINKLQLLINDDQVRQRLENRLQAIVVQQAPQAKSQKTLQLTTEMLSKLYTTTTLEWGSKCLDGLSGIPKLTRAFQFLGIREGLTNIQESEQEGFIVTGDHNIITTIRDLCARPVVVHLTPDIAQSLYKEVERRFGKESMQVKQMEELSNREGSPNKIRKTLQLLEIPFTNIDFNYADGYRFDANITALNTIDGIHFQHAQKTATPAALSPISDKKIIISNYRRDMSYEEKNTEFYDNSTVGMYAPNWVRDALAQLNTALTGVTLKKPGGVVEDIKLPLTLQMLFKLARNESENGNGDIAFYLYANLPREIVLALKDLARHVVIAGVTETTHFGGYRSVDQRVKQQQEILIGDMAGLSFRRFYDTGRLVLIGADLPRGKLDDFIFEKVVGESKKTVQNCASDKTGRYIKVTWEDKKDLYLDTLAYQRFVAQDFIIYARAMAKTAQGETLNLKFLQQGMGLAAGPFEKQLQKPFLDGIHLGLRILFAQYANEIQNIKKIELPYCPETPERPAIEATCLKHDRLCTFTQYDAAQKTSTYTTATTTCSNLHAAPGNRLQHDGVAGSIAENVVGKLHDFSPVHNRKMKEDTFFAMPTVMTLQPESGLTAKETVMQVTITLQEYYYMLNHLYYNKRAITRSELDDPDMQRGMRTILNAYHLSYESNISVNKDNIFTFEVKYKTYLRLQEIKNPVDQFLNQNKDLNKRSLTRQQERTSCEKQRQEARAARIAKAKQTPLAPSPTSSPVASSSSSSTAAPVLPALQNLFVANSTAPVVANAPNEEFTEKLEVLKKAIEIYLLRSEKLGDESSQAYMRARGIKQGIDLGLTTNADIEAVVNNLKNYIKKIPFDGTTLNDAILYALTGNAHDGTSAFNHFYMQLSEADKRDLLTQMFVNTFEKEAERLGAKVTMSMS